ncbi:Vitamin B12 import ATP-binding protein BtuD [Streptomyces antimycoticus]
MTEFVLVAGAWLGSWAWDGVVPELRAAGHGVHALTLSGLAEKQGVQAGQQTHVQDIVGEVERLDLRDVVLVGHSYAGIPVGQAAERIGDRLAHVVFVDSNQEDGPLSAIEAGDVDEAHFETIGDDWDVEERALATLGSLGLGDVELDRTVGHLSGGETVLLRLAALLLERPDVLLLDEPTNNLDLFARRRLYDAVDSWRSGVLVVVSHDRELLERVDRIAELRSGSVTWYGGGWSAYREALATQQEAAARMLRVAEADVRRQKRELEETHIKLARRQRNSKKMDVERRAPRIVAGARKRSAQESAGKLRDLQEDRLHEARERREEAAEAVRDDAEIRVSLPHTAVPAGRTVFSLSELGLRYGALRDATLHVQGPERIALVGRNGAGKTTLLRTLTGQLAPLSGEARTFVPLRFLPQRLDVLDDELSVAANVAHQAPRDHRQPDPLPARALPVQGGAGGTAGRHPLGWRTFPGRPRGHHARRTGPAAAAARRAHQQPRHGRCTSS